MKTDSRIKISQLRAFVAVAEHGNFSEAALDIGLSQSTVSYAIAALEEELGVVLLNRGRHGAALTPCGQEVLDNARQVLGLLNTMQQTANRHRGLEGGLVRVAAPRSVATHLLPQVIAQYRKQFPQISVAIAEQAYYTEVEQCVRDGQADLGFTLLPVGEGLEIQQVFEDEFVVLLPPKTLAPDEPLTWEQLVTFPMILTPSAPPHRHARAVIQHLLKHGQTLQVAYEVQQDSTLVSMVRQGLGATIVARLAAEPIPEDVQVRGLPEPLTRAIAIITAKDAMLPQAAFTFLDQLKLSLATQENPQVLGTAKSA